MKIFSFIKLPPIRKKKNPDKKMNPVNKSNSIVSEFNYDSINSIANEDYSKSKNQENDDETKSHIKELIEEIKAINIYLEENNLPYFFDIYKIYDDYIIEMTFKDKNGNIIESKKKNITHEKFSELKKHIESGEGLLFESLG